MSKKISAAILVIAALLVGVPSAFSEKSTGIVKVVSRPAGASVSVGGKYYSPTPVLIELPTGKHNLVVTRPGHIPAKASVVIKKNQVVRKEIKLGATPGKKIRVHRTKQGQRDFGPGTVTIVTSPPGLTVYMSDLVVPQPTPVAFDMRAGIYELTLQQDGEIVYRKTVFIHVGRTLELDIVVHRRRRIDDSDPWKASH
ncbi:MAG: PEGA domain-containing protein [Deltaproteobacteria bacterium]|nr:PEGA domain-containing protein [Deltaproteobacteria bacterium]